MKRILAMLCLMIVMISMAPGTQQAAATPPRLKPCPLQIFPYELGALKTLADTETWALFEDWTIEGVSITRRCSGLPVDYIVIDYVLPAEYSAKNLTYHVRMTFEIDWQGVLTNAKSIRLLLLNLAEKIASFEHDPTVEQYLVIAKDPQIANYQEYSPSVHMDQLKLSVNDQNWLVYDLTHRQVLRLRFTDSMLVGKKELLVPAISALPEPAPSGHNTGIKYDAVTGEIDQFDVPSNSILITRAVNPGPTAADLAAADTQKRNRSLLFWVPTLILGLFMIVMFTKGKSGRARG